jgi:hypothetical protein
LIIIPVHSIAQVSGGLGVDLPVNTTIPAMNMSSLNEDDEPNELKEDIAVILFSSSWTSIS